ncbi:MAG: hypothetical protein J7605_00380 [Variovorax sp.]|nr:hypothetical protein [Variovorax sp.]
MSVTFSTLPILEEAELIFDASETRTILSFFWPERSGDIANLSIGTGGRRFAQQLLIVAVDASYAMGFVDILANAFVVRRPSAPMSMVIKKLARGYAKHWWKHATRKNLEDAAIYNSVRLAVARNFGSELEMFLGGIEAKFKPHVFSVSANGAMGGVWKC